VVLASAEEDFHRLGAIIIFLTMPSTNNIPPALVNALSGTYELLQEIGWGGMGVVYAGRDIRLDRLVAIKVLPSW
jgi:serine/threonine protein kinase